MTKSIKTLAIAGIACLTIFGVASLSPVFAETTTATTSDIYQLVINKLGLTNVTSSQLKSAFESSREETLKADFDTKLSEAVKSGKLSQDEADLAKKINDYIIANRPETIKPQEMNSNLTFEERGKLMDEMQSKMKEMHNKMLSDLGISDEQFVASAQALRDANINLPMGKGGHKEKGMFGGRTMRGGPVEMMNTDSNIPTTSNDAI